MRTVMTRAMKTKQTRYALRPDVFLLHPPDGTARLLDMNGSFCAVCATGAVMLQEVLADGCAEAVQRIAARYGADPQEVWPDLQAFLDQLERRRLIYRPGSTHEVQRSKGFLTGLLLAPLLRSLHECIPRLRGRAWILLTLAKLSFCLFGWARAIAVWQRCHRHFTRRLGEGDLPHVVRAVDGAVREAAAGHLLETECKERALCSWALLRAAGAPAALMVGVRYFPLAGHCWCESGPWTVGDDPDTCSSYVPVIRYE